MAARRIHPFREDLSHDATLSWPGQTPLGSYYRPNCPALGPDDIRQKRRAESYRLEGNTALLRHPEIRRGTEYRV